MLRTGSLLLLTLGMALCSFCPAIAQPGAASVAKRPLQPGEFQLDCEAGYARFAFPIGDAALARKWTEYHIEKDLVNWASRGEMSYQLAFDYSVVPVQFHIEHRRPEAFAGTVEIETAHGYGASEDPLGHRTLIRHDFVAPPSVPIEFTLGPRVVPPVRPRSSERLIVRVFQKGIARPIYRRELTVTQLEPAHLYSLVLDDTAIHGQEINAGNHLQLHIPAQRSGIVLDPSIYSCTHYFVGCPRRAVTGLPLAARQFAFVLADFGQVQNWTALEQTALMQFVLGGGRLILFNTGGATKWQGARLSSILPVGRGWLIPVQDGRPDADLVAQAWLEGEMVEFALYARGSVNGTQLDPNYFNAFSDTNLQLDEVYASPPPGSPPMPLSHRPGYLHPLWLYRTAADFASVEPWDYPEFIHFSGDEVQGNLLLRSILASQPGTTAPLSMPKLLATDRKLPAWWLPSLGLLLLAIAGYAFPLPRIPLFLHRAAVLALLAGAVALWQHTPATPPRHGEMQLIDRDLSTAVGISRRVDASFCKPAAAVSFPLEPDTLVRRVDWSPAGEWELTGSTDAGGNGKSGWHGTGAGPYAALRSDALLAAPPDLGFSAKVQPVEDGYRLTIDAKGLAPGQLIIVQSALGWTPLRANRAPVNLYLNIPHIPAEPGLARAQALQRLMQRWGLQIRSLKSATNWQARALLAQLLEDGWTPELQRGSSSAEILRLGWSALLQDPLGGRGLPVNQIVIYTVIPAKLEAEATAGTVGATWARLCLPLQ